MEFSVLKGKILSEIAVGDESIYFTTIDQKKYVMQHNQCCCEIVHVEEISGIPIHDLIGDPILMAEVRTNHIDADFGDQQWTFYELATVKGNVTIRWYGASNGYYSIDVAFEEA